ncbi:MAG: hypothetical protein DRJ61_16360 [Acidobacteria bacterium]|nr:MAG: hypothetical protein DRJ61_16360 [Acidobacteriota bacterium]
MRQVWILLLATVLLACTPHPASSSAEDAQHLIEGEARPSETTEQAVKAVDQEPPLVLTGEAAEKFLKTAEITALEEFDTKGITKPRKATLTDGNITVKAVFKTVDEFYPKQKLTTGRMVFKLRDRWQHEIAAYEMDKLLGLGIVPPTVERKIRRETGSLSLWVNGTMTEWHRKKVKKLSPPSAQEWNDQMFTIRLFMQLTWDTDYNNISNLLIDADWKIWKIDSSRAFLPPKKLRREGGLTRFSRPVLQALEELTREEFEEKLGPWLAKDQMKGLWARRIRILELAQERIEDAQERVEENGEEAVLYD